MICWKKFSVTNEHVSISGGAADENGYTVTPRVGLIDSTDILDVHRDVFTSELSGRLSLSIKPLKQASVL